MREMHWGDFFAGVAVTIFVIAFLSSSLPENLISLAFALFTKEFWAAAATGTWRLVVALVTFEVWPVSLVALFTLLMLVCGMLSLRNRD